MIDTKKAPDGSTHQVPSIVSDSLTRLIENTTPGDVVCQDNALDYAELTEKFTPKRKHTLLLAASMERVGCPKKAERMRDCATDLAFAREIGNDGSFGKAKLLHANFCKVRLCPMCDWRRSEKIFSNLSKCLKYLEPMNYRYLFLTLTIKNVDGQDLPDTIGRLMYAWKKFHQSKAFSSRVCGAFRTLEITRNRKDGTYHPHFHVLLAVKESYFKHAYLKRSEWLQMWRDAYGDQSITQVDIAVCKSNLSPADVGTDSIHLANAVLEVSKYCCKTRDIIGFGDSALTDDIVRTLMYSLASRQLCSMLGCFLVASKALKLQDAESDDADLIHVDGHLNPELTWLISKYQWNPGLTLGYSLDTPFLLTPETREKHKDWYMKLFSTR